MNHIDSLQRFVDAQTPVYEQACRELAAGHKTSHWMWFVFPQLRSLGRSSTALHYGIASAEEALAYARHPVLGPRLVKTSRLVLDVDGRSAHQIFGSPDDLKLCSSMTLFEAVAPIETVFAAVLDKYYAGQRDGQTLALLR